ncbi:coat protein [Lake Sarah-associated circular virus-6]|uniref:coat protein n=1 Tax=Lake Sarah-associated circular virus-6 TaxID=1685783 RepID=UPI0007776891|nr:coat protein [Lake Sarah-associated circular virus-6]ALE29597.1 coat protein [Lake Sarah-associated circular virus-6]
MTSDLQRKRNLSSFGKSFSDLFMPNKNKRRNVQFGGPAKRAKNSVVAGSFRSPTVSNSAGGVIRGGSQGRWSSLPFQRNGYKQYINRLLNPPVIITDRWTGLLKQTVTATPDLPTPVNKIQNFFIDSMTIGENVSAVLTNILKTHSGHGLGMQGATMTSSTFAQAILTLNTPINTVQQTFTQSFRYQKQNKVTFQNMTNNNVKVTVFCFAVRDLRTSYNILTPYTTLDLAPGTSPNLPILPAASNAVLEQAKQTSGNVVQDSLCVSTGFDGDSLNSFVAASTDAQTCNWFLKNPWSYYKWRMEYRKVSQVSFMLPAGQGTCTRYFNHSFKLNNKWSFYTEWAQHPAFTRFYLIQTETQPMSTVTTGVLPSQQGFLAYPPATVGLLVESKTVIQRVSGVTRASHLREPLVDPTPITGNASTGAADFIAPASLVSGALNMASEETDQKQAGVFF